MLSSGSCQTCFKGSLWVFCCQDSSWGIGCPGLEDDSDITNVNVMGCFETYYPRYHSACWISLPPASQSIRSFCPWKPVCRAAPSGIYVYSLRLEVHSLPAEGCSKSQPYSISESLMSQMRDVTQPVSVETNWSRVKHSTVTSYAIWKGLMYGQSLRSACPMEATYCNVLKSHSWTVLSTVAACSNHEELLQQ